MRFVYIKQQKWQGPGTHPLTASIPVIPLYLPSEYDWYSTQAKLFRLVVKLARSWCYWRWCWPGFVVVLCVWVWVCVLYSQLLEGCILVPCLNSYTISFHRGYSIENNTSFHSSGPHRAWLLMTKDRQESLAMWHWKAGKLPRSLLSKLQTFFNRRVCHTPQEMMLQLSEHKLSSFLLPTCAKKWQ